MVKLAVAGTSEFIVGFQLAGIKSVIEIGDKPFNELKSLRGRKDVGIVIVDEKIIDGLEPYQRFEIEDCIEPVFIPVSTKVEQESLKRLIKKSIGVDLWK